VVRGVDVDEILPAADFVPDTEPTIVLSDSDIGLSAVEIRDKIQVLKESIDKDYFYLCRLLWEVNKKSYYHDWGYGTFKEYIASEVQFKVTKAMYLVQIWQSLYVNSGDPDVFNKVINVGWSKAKELARVVTKENVDDWVEKAKHLTVDALVKEVKQTLKEKIPDDTAQALIEDESNRGTPIEVQSKNATYTFGYEDYQTICTAIEQVKKHSPGISNGAAIANLAREFIGSNPDVQDAKEYALNMIARYEAMYGLQVVVYDPEQKEVIYGSETLLEITGE
jgi:predicted NAD-dependent protein-ADP-ribosyltransferase YbiA (DUF1768 family)